MLPHGLISTYSTELEQAYQQSEFLDHYGEYVVGKSKRQTCVLAGMGYSFAYDTAAGLGYVAQLFLFVEVVEWFFVFLAAQKALRRARAMWSLALCLSIRLFPRG